MEHLVAHAGLEYLQHLRGKLAAQRVCAKRAERDRDEPGDGAEEEEGAVHDRDTTRSRTPRHAATSSPGAPLMTGAAIRLHGIRVSEAKEITSARETPRGRRPAPLAATHRRPAPERTPAARRRARATPPA